MVSLGPWSLLAKASGTSIPPAQGAALHALGALASPPIWTSPPPTDCRGLFQKGRCDSSGNIVNLRISRCRTRCAKAGEQPTPGSVSSTLGKAASAAALCGILCTGPVDVAAARPEGVNKPELLPAEFTRVIDVAGFLSDGQERRLSEDLRRLEQDTGYKVRLLAQNYPETPGLAIRDYWGVDDDTVVFVADPTMGNILNFNVGAGVDLRVPRSFWSRLAGKYGNLFYWREKGEDAAIEAAVIAIDNCLREDPGPRQCAEVK